MDAEDKDGNKIEGDWRKVARNAAMRGAARVVIGVVKKTGSSIFRRDKGIDIDKIAEFGSNKWAEDLTTKAGGPSKLMSKLYTYGNAIYDTALQGVDQRLFASAEIGRASCRERV